MKYLIVLVSFILLFINSLYSEDFIKKYSSSHSWQGVDGEGNILISGNRVTEIRIISQTEEIIEAHLLKTMTPYNTVINSTFLMHKNESTYDFNFVDNYGNTIDGYFKFNRNIAELYIVCVAIQEDRKSDMRIYDGLNTLFDTSNDDRYFYKSISLDKIEVELNKINSLYWPLNDTNLLLNYRGQCNNFLIYSSNLIWGESKRSTQRLIFFDLKYNYLGNFYDVPIDSIAIKDNKIIFNSISSELGNLIAITDELPNKVYIDGEMVQLSQ